MRIITYSLHHGGIDSNRYYEDVINFSEVVTKKGLDITLPWIKKLKDYIEENQLEKVRTEEEYMLEVLTLGVLWLRYSDDATKINKIPSVILKKLVDIRVKGGKLKAGADLLRGVLGTLVLYSKHRSYLVTQIKYTMKNLINLIRWLESTGEFIQEVKRLKNWTSFLYTLNDEEVEKFIREAVSFARWFQKESIISVGRYTESVETYLEQVKKSHSWREDLIFCSRQRLEYHLNMVGAEIMNKAYKDDFINTSRKAVFLPACLRKRLDGRCMATVEKGIMYCCSCSLDCEVSKIKKLGEVYGYEVLIIPHETAVFSNDTIRDGELGIIGVACVTNLLAGGWKAKAFRIPAQCVVLDYCGCKNHWDDKGFSTSINMERLKDIMSKSVC